MKSTQFLDTLIAETQQIITQVEHLNEQELSILTWREHATSWSILECIEHLNLYGDFYLPHIKHSIRTSSTSPSKEFRSGWLGSYFAKSMLPSGKHTKMRTFKDKNPLNKSLDKTSIDRFLTQQAQLVDLLVLAKEVNIDKIRIPTSISKWIQLKLGDTFHFYINHIIRHLYQINSIQIKQGLIYKKIPWQQL